MTDKSMKVPTADSSVSMALIKKFINARIMDSAFIWINRPLVSRKLTNVSPKLILQSFIVFLTDLEIC